MWNYLRICWQVWGRFVRRWNTFEELFISYILLAMTLVTFSQVVSRYIFNAGAVWALELTTFLFAWLTLFGMSYGIRQSLHLGIDALILQFPRSIQKALILFSVGLCILYGGILLTGAWEYWWIMFQRGIGTEDLYVPRILVEFFTTGSYKPTKIPRWIPYTILPLGLVLLMVRLIEAGVQIWHGKRKALIASHEVEEMLEEFGGHKSHDSSDNDDQASAENDIWKR